MNFLADIVAAAAVDDDANDDDNYTDGRWCFY